ncbi:MAG TPA: pyruvate kinase [Flavobacteriaceae bacterium]|nr:pyruvate kinase [Flavobacteriaceae bacterium]
MKYRKKTKIVATLGPSTLSKEILKNMLEAGVNLFRVNFSHAKHSDVKNRIDTIRELNEKHGFNAGILADLQGPKLRVGTMKEEVIVSKGDEISFVTGKEFQGTAERVFMNYEDFPKDVQAGERILLDDGKLIFEIISSNKKDEVVTKVIQGGPLRSRKGVNLPNTNISLPAMTEKDIKDALFAIEQKVDWIALSFVRHAKDLQELQKIIADKSDHKIPIIAKIEKPEGVKNIDKIVAYCDGLMVARGDLGVEIPAHEVPLIQKQLVLKAKKARIPVIIATQMMETMITSLTPTRAEVNDVANSVMDGADAVMLSGETSVGNYPVQVIQKMAQIIRSVEDSPLIKVPHDPPTVRTKRYITKSICFHAAEIANEIDARAICTLTNSGYTAFQISAWRPESHILAFTSNHRILTQLSLLWGVSAVFYDEFVSTDETVSDINNIAKEKKYVKKGDFVVNLSAMPIIDKGMVNTLRISEIK